MWKISRNFQEKSLRVQFVRPGQKFSNIQYKNILQQPTSATLIAWFILKSSSHHLVWGIRNVIIDFIRNETKKTKNQELQ